MYTFKRHIILTLALVAVFLQTAAQTPEDNRPFIETTDNVPNISVSLLTCTAGKDLYTKFGHTALRVCDKAQGYDIVFNYGCFNYNADNFIFKFILGQTDYMLEIEPATFFLERYQHLGVGVKEQQIQLTPMEAQTIVSLLKENLRPENQEYRYSWLYDNCTERARNMLEQAIDGLVEYDRKTDPELTVRNILHDCLQNVPWMDFGISLILGSEIDMVADKRVQMFIPEIFSKELNAANISRRGESHQKMVGEERILLKPTLEADKPGPMTPNVVFTTLLIITLLISIRELKTGRQWVWFDVLLCTCQGLMGCIIAFLYFFSQHPSVDSNWLVMVFNPLPLFYAGWMLRCDIKNKRNYLSLANTAALSAYIPTMLLCMQTFYPATYLMVFVLWIRSIMQLKHCRFAFTNRNIQKLIVKDE